MNCNWCQDEEVARALMVAICNDKNGIWKQEANPCLCMCKDCVTAYHKLKNEYLVAHPQHEKVLYEIEIERLQNHLLKVHSLYNSNSKNHSEIIENNLSVPLVEILQYPYLLFNRDIMDLFVKCFLLLNGYDKPWTVKEKYPGIYLLLFNPCSKVRSWALTTTQHLGWISLEDYPIVCQVISCMLKIALYDLLHDDSEGENGPLPKSSLSKETKPSRHIYHPLPKKDLWLGYSRIFKLMEGNVLRMLLNYKGHSQILDIIKDMLKEKDAESNSCFWSLVLILHITMKKIGSTFWLLLSFDDSPESLFNLIVQHSEFKNCLNLLQMTDAKSTNNLQICGDDDNDNYKLKKTLLGSYQGFEELAGVFEVISSHDPFFWTMSFITTVLDLEDIASKVINDILEYLLSILNERKSFVSACTYSELEYHVLNCVCNILMYLINKKLAHFLEKIISSWLDVLCHVLFQMRFQNMDKSSMIWRILRENVRSLFVSVLIQAEQRRIQTIHNYHGLSNWLRNLNPNTTVGVTELTELKKLFTEIFKSIAEMHLLEAVNLNGESCNLSSSDEEFNDVATSGDLHKASFFKRDQNHGSLIFHEPGSSLAPIMLDSDSDNDRDDPLMPQRNVFTESFQKVFIDPISYDEDLDYSEDVDLQFGMEKSDTSIMNSATDTTKTEVNSQIESRVLKENREMVIIDDDCLNDDSSEVSTSKHRKKRKYSDVMDRTNEEQRQCYPHLKTCAYTILSVEGENHHLKTAENQENSEMMQKPEISAPCSTKDNDENSEIVKSKQKSFDKSPVGVERGLFDFLDNIKGAQKNDEPITTTPTKASNAAEKDFVNVEEVRIERHEPEDCSSNKTIAGGLDAKQNLAEAHSEVDLTINSRNESKESEKQNDVKIKTAIVESKQFEPDNMLRYKQYVKKKELRSLLKVSNQEAGSVDAKFDERLAEPKNELTGSNSYPADSSNTHEVPGTELQSLPIIRKHKLYNMNSLLKYILAWQPMWLENEQEDELQIMLPCEPELVKSKYDSYDNYMLTMWPLILIEFFAQMIKDFKENESPLLQCKLKYREQDPDSQNFDILHCASLQECHLMGKDFRYPLEEDLVILRCVDEYTTEIFGLIEDVEKTPMRDDNDQNGKFSYVLLALRIKVSNLLPGVNITSVQIQIVTRMVPLFRRWEALMCLPKSLLAGDILNPFRRQVFEPKRNCNKPKFDKYNVCQSEAIATITEAVVQAFPLPKLRLLQGPPGTGKTYALKGLIKNMLQTISSKEKARILLCAPSNAAVDEIAFRLLQDPPKIPNSTKEIAKKRQGHTNCGSFNLLRIGSPSQINHRIGKCSLEYLVHNEITKLKLFSNPDAMKEEIKKILQNLKQLDRICTKLKMGKDRIKHSEWKKRMLERERWQRRYEELQKRLKMSGAKCDLKQEENRLRTHYLIKADIICCTLSGAGSKHMINTFKNEWDGSNGAPFSCVIIDEAGQCCEPEALIPLQYGSSKLVLVGDPAQLPATVFSKRAFRYGYGQSLFERIQNNLLEHVDVPVLMLEEQYRMHPEICAFPSQKFYDGRLKTAREVLQRRTPVGIRPFSVLNVINGKEAIESRGTIHNPEERKYVSSIINEIRHKEIISMDKVGVISPYRKQVEKLKEEISQWPTLKGVEINTIDGFQGKEKDIIILSCVRACRGQSSIGFLRDPQRLNVALTRAKHSLIVLLHAGCLQVDEDWKDLIDFARSENLLFNMESPQDISSAVFGTEIIEKPSGKLKNKCSLPSRYGSKEENNRNLAPLVYEDLSEDETDKESRPGNLMHKTKVDNENHPKQNSKKLVKSQSKTAHPNIESTKILPTEGTKVSADDNSDVKFSESASDSCIQRNRLNSTKIHYKFPHSHSGGTKCVNKCKKIGERATPSDAYYKLPHLHSDGLRCVDKCIRVEEREKKRKKLQEDQKETKSPTDRNKSYSTPNTSNENISSASKIEQRLNPLKGLITSSSIINSADSSQLVPKNFNSCSDIESEASSESKIKMDDRIKIFPPLPSETELTITRSQLPPKPADASAEVYAENSSDTIDICGNKNDTLFVSSDPILQQTEDMDVSSGSSCEDPPIESNAPWVVKTSSCCEQTNEAENPTSIYLSEPILLQRNYMSIDKESSSKDSLHQSDVSMGPDISSIQKTINATENAAITYSSERLLQNDDMDIDNESDIDSPIETDTPLCSKMASDNKQIGRAADTTIDNTKSSKPVLLQRNDMEIDSKASMKQSCVKTNHNNNEVPQASCYFLNDTYQPKVLLQNCLTDFNHVIQTSKNCSLYGHSLLNYDERSKGYQDFIFSNENISSTSWYHSHNESQFLAPSSFSHSFFNNNVSTDANISPYKQIVKNIDIPSSSLSAPFTEASVSHSSSRSASPLATIISNANIDEEIHQIRLATTHVDVDDHTHEDNLSPSVQARSSFINARDDDDFLEVNPGIHLKKPRIVEKMPPKTSRELFIMKTSADSNDSSNNSEVKDTQIDTSFLKVSQQIETESMPLVTKKKKRVKRCVRTGTLRDNDTNMTFRRFADSNIEENVRKSFKSKNDANRSFEMNRFVRVPVSYSDHLNVKFRETDDAFSEVSNANRNANNGQFVRQKIPRNVSSSKQRLPGFYMSKVEEITQRIRRRNLSSNKTMQLLSQEPISQRRRRSRSSKDS